MLEFPVHSIATYINRNKQCNDRPHSDAGEGTRRERSARTWAAGIGSCYIRAIAAVQQWLDCPQILLGACVWKYGLVDGELLALVVAYEIDFLQEGPI